MNPIESPDAELSFPDIEWRPAWPVRYPFSAIIYLLTTLVVCFAATVGFAALAVQDGVDKDNSATSVGAFGACLAMAAFGVLVVSMSGILDNRLSPGARYHSDNKYGGGIVLRDRRRRLTILLVAFGGLSAYGISAWFAWRSGAGQSGLLPMSKDSSGGATFALILGIIFAALIIVVGILTLRQVTVVALYPAGIHWQVARQFGGKEWFVHWDEIDSLERGEVKSSRNPLAVIMVHRHIAQSSTEDDQSVPTKFVIPVHRMACDSNMLLAIMSYLKSNTNSRNILARPDAPAWFMPPSLRTRTRLSREATEGR